MSETTRLDLGVIENWIGLGSRVLDLGCGDGTLLRTLINNKQVKGYGLEIDRDQIIECVAKGVNVIEQDLNRGLTNFDTDSFDSVVMTQALQVMHRPDQVLDEMLRVGKECIVTFPNFGNWRARLHLGLRGRMPVTKQLAYQWYDTPNIHFCTVNDFEALCAEKNITILHRQTIAEQFPDQALKDLWPNAFASTAIYHLSA